MRNIQNGQFAPSIQEKVDNSSFWVIVKPGYESWSPRMAKGSVEEKNQDVGRYIYQRSWSESERRPTSCPININYLNFHFESPILWLWRKWRILHLMTCCSFCEERLVRTEVIEGWRERRPWWRSKETAPPSHLVASHWSWTMGHCRSTSSAPTVGQRPPRSPESLTPEHLKLSGVFFLSGTFPTWNHGPAAVRRLWLLRWPRPEINVSCNIALVLILVVLIEHIRVVWGKTKSIFPLLV